MEDVLGTKLIAKTGTEYGLIKEYAKLQGWLKVGEIVEERESKTTYLTQSGQLVQIQLVQSDGG